MLDKKESPENNINSTVGVLRNKEVKKAKKNINVSYHVREAEPDTISLPTAVRLPHIDNLRQITRAQCEPIWRSFGQRAAAEWEEGIR